MPNNEMFDVLKYQEGGDHYKKLKVQPAFFINENRLPFAEGNAIKYICRHINKGGEQDLQKAKHYIDMIIERDYGDDAEKSKVFAGVSIKDPVDSDDIKISYSNDELNGAIYYPSGASVGKEGFDE